MLTLAVLAEISSFFSSAIKFELTHNHQMILRTKKMNKLQRALLGLQEIESKQEKAIFSFAVKPIYDPLELRVYVFSHKKKQDNL